MKVLVKFKENIKRKFKHGIKFGGLASEWQNFSQDSLKDWVNRNVMDFNKKHTFPHQGQNNNTYH